MKDEEVESTGGDESRDLDMVTVFQAAGNTSEMEAMSVKGVLDAAGIFAMIVGDPRFPNLPEEVRVAREHVTQAKASDREDAISAGPAAAAEAESSRRNPNPRVCWGLLELRLIGLERLIQDSRPGAFQLASPFCRFASSRRTEEPIEPQAAKNPPRACRFGAADLHMRTLVWKRIRNGVIAHVLGIGQAVRAASPFPSWPFIDSIDARAFRFDNIPSVCRHRVTVAVILESGGAWPEAAQFLIEIEM
jgi:hypothetical protein